MHTFSQRFAALVLCILTALCCLSVGAEENTITVGSSGMDVLDVKQRLQALGYIGRGNLTGTFTEKNAESVRQFQRINGLEVTGMVDQATREALFSKTALPNSTAAAPTATPAPTAQMPAEEGALTVGASGQDVLEIKQRLQALGYIGKGTLTATLTEKNAGSIRQFQLINSLEVTGTVNQATREAILSDSALPNPQPTMPLATPGPTPAADLPSRDAEGFLEGEGEFFYENDEGGLWIYLSPTLQIIICRRVDSTIPLIWFETEIITRGESFRAAVSDTEHLWRGYRYPYEYAAEEGFVLAFSDDFFADRVEKGHTVGIIIRNGQILSSTTHAQSGHQLPNLDMMAQYPDGSLKVYHCNEISAQELLDEGAVNVFSFGPILLRDGEINPLLYDEYYRSLEPRQALGMIEPGHYLLVSVQGRRQDSVGTPLQRVAEIMQRHGVTQALNLDGGNTMALIFRGRMLNKLATYQNKQFIRMVTSIVGIGHTDDQAQ